MRLLLIVVAGLCTAVPCVRSDQEAEVSESELARSVRKELAGLPHYGVFDLLTCQVNDRGVVALGGFVYQDSLKSLAEKAVKKVDGVKEVENKIEVLPVSLRDEDLRFGVYRAIYRDSSLSRYGTGDDMASASRPRHAGWGRGFRRFGVFGQSRWGERPSFGMAPLGQHWIHIVVKDGEVLLGGVVDSQADKDAAGIKAHGVLGVRKVVNDLEIAPRTSN